VLRLLDSRRDEEAASIQAGSCPGLPGREEADGTSHLVTETRRSCCFEAWLARVQLQLQLSQRPLACC